MTAIPAARREGRDKARAWWSHRRVMIWGAAKSGIAAAKLLSQLNANVTLSDPKASDALTGLEDLPPDVNTLFGVPNTLGDAEVVIPSPGIRPSHQLIKAARAAKLVIMSEVELAARVSEANIIAITGTDGKSTTTKLICEAVRANDVWSQAVGNIGDPISNWALSAPADGYFALEVSAFQLWSTSWLDAVCGIITNIAEDHHDYFDHDAGAYRAAKLKLGELLSQEGCLLYPPQGLTLTQEEIDRYGSTRLRTYDTPEVQIESPLIGGHNQLNLSATFSVLSELGLDHQKAKLRLKSFSPLPYRMTLTRELDGVQYLNDSKATNVHAACVGLSTLTGSLIVITGGYDKQLNLSPFIQILKQRARLVLTIGQTGQYICETLEDLNVSVQYCGNLETAVRLAATLAQPGDRVCLSPAASSFDQFESYEARGAAFDRLVHHLEPHV